MTPIRSLLVAVGACALLYSLAATGVVAAADFRLRSPSVSDRDLLGGTARLAVEPVERTRVLARGGGSDTLRVAAIRIEFQREDPDDPNTTGDGTFDFSQGTPGELEAPPHDRAYFERQLTALRNYYDTVSLGQLTLDTTLFPPGDRESFTVPQFMRFYNPDTTQAALDIRLAEFFRDAVVAADPGVTFGDFDAVMIFHAGVGQDIALADLPRSDIPSAFISFRELKSALAPDDDSFMGIEVDGGTHRVRDGFWVPETDVLVATDTRPRIDFALKGVMVSLMGSQLGLPSLFNTDSGAPGIGRFGLMDQGAGNELGAIPAAPSAWSRFFLGWETPLVVQNMNDVSIGASLVDGTAPRLVMIPIDSREYFLIENRQEDLDGDGTFSAIADGDVIIDVTSGEYDAGIPGSGILIWHIDEEIIQRGLADNSVNADFMHRGVDIEEADAVEDIGLRPDGGFGLGEDMYFDPNATEFGPSTLPPSSTNHRHDTHVTVKNVSTSALVMTFDVSNDIFQPGWPDTTGLELATTSVTAGGSTARLALVSPDGLLVVLEADGSDTFPPIDLGGAGVGMPLLTTLFAGSDTVRVVAAFSGGVRVFEMDGSPRPEWSLDFEPAPGTDVLRIASVRGPGDEDIRLAMLDTDGVMLVWTPDGIESLLPPSPAVGAPRSNVINAEFSSAPGDVVPELVYAFGDRLALLAPGLGDSQRALPLPAGLSDGPLWIAAESLDTTGALDRLFWIVDRAGTVALIDDQGAIQPGWPRRTGDRHDAPPALADVRGDGTLDIVLAGTGRVWAMSRTSALIEGWPVQVDTSTVGVPITSSPLVADLDDDGALDVAIASPAGGLYAWDRAGLSLSGWPLPAGASSSGSPALVDLDSDQDVEIVVADDTGAIYAYDLPGDPEAVVWEERGRRGRSFNSIVTPGTPSPGGELLPSDSIVIYPNPSPGPAAIRFELGGSGSAPGLAVRIVDATGRNVRELSSNGQSGTLNEVRWDGRDADGQPVPSGVYVVRITAESNGVSAQHFRTLAVTR